MDLATVERTKYEKTWTRQPYRESSPGERLYPISYKYLTAAGMEPGQSLLDFGTGTGRAAHMFASQGGMKVGAIDIAHNCMDQAVVDAGLVDLTVANLFHTGFKGIRKAHWGHCSDVMEHIPPEMVHTVLANISNLVRKSIWFCINTRPDEWFGVTMHLTVQDPAWWIEELMPHFGSVQMVGHNARELYVMGHNG